MGVEGRGVWVRGKMTVCFGKIYANGVRSGKVEWLVNGKARADGTRKGKDTPASTSALVSVGAVDSSVHRVVYREEVIVKQGKADGKIEKELIKVQRELNKAKNAAEVSDALYALIPHGSLPKYDAYREKRTCQFVEQLQMIKASESALINAVCYYLTSSKMRLRWSAMNLKKERLAQFRENLLAIYQHHADANKEGREPPEVRGGRTFADTVAEANKTDAIEIAGTERKVELPFGTIEGEYHHMANGEDGVKLGWHPDWEHKLETGEIND